MPYQILIEKPALKQLSKLDKQPREDIIAAIDALADNPRPHGYKKLVDEGGTYRIKVKNHRILYEVVDKVLTITVISIIKRNERTY